MKRIHITAFFLHVAACTGFPGCGTATPTATKPPTTTPTTTDELIISRASGVAPLAVFFDGTGNDHGAGSFHDRGYVWSFGDSLSGTWATTGRSKNSARGPLAAHVFETPGTYTVTVTVTDSAAAPITRLATITVEDPDTVFAGTMTICFSTGADFTGCPSGAEHVTLTAFEVALQRAASGTRLLFKRGDTFSGANQAAVNVAGPGIIGAFGVGAPPDINLTYAEGLILLSARNPQFDDWRIMDLNVVGNGQGFFIDAENTITRITLLRLSMSNTAQSLSISTSKIDYYQSPLHHEIALVECSFRDFVGNYGVFISAAKLMALGNTIVNTHDHIFRTQHVNQGVFNNNRLGGADGHGHTLKLHAESVGGEPNGPQRPSVDFVINGNIFEGNTNDWSVSIGPQGEIYNETVGNAILDGNHFIAGANNQLQLHLAARDVTVRNNIFEMSNALDPTAIQVVRRGVEPEPDNNRIYNNTCYSSKSGGTATCVLVANSANNTLVHNNLLVAPNASTTHALDNHGVGTDLGANLRLDASVFSNPTPVEPSDFSLSSANGAIDAGMATGTVQLDFSGAERSVDGDGDGEAHPDAGAFEFSGP